MPITIESSYSKKLGLPGFSSHSYSVTVRSEVTDLSQVNRESAKLYALLQGSVDRELQKVGFFPVENAPPEPRRMGGFASKPKEEIWSCSDIRRKSNSAATRSCTEKQSEIAVHVDYSHHGV